MANPFLGEIRIFAGNFAPIGWAACQGQILQISQNAALFSILGTNFGGNGTSTFGLPNFQAATPMDAGQGAGLTPRVVGEVGGSPTVTLLANQIPVHSHTISGVTAPSASSNSPGGNFLGDGRTLAPYAPAATGTPMAATAIGPAGGNVPHNNLQPYLTLFFIIALQGVYPTRG